MFAIPNNRLFFISFMLLATACGRQIESIEDTFEDGTPKLVVRYKIKDDDTLKLKETQYFPNGNVRISGAFNKNKRHGKWIAWRSNGNKWSEGTYMNGLRQGQSLIYYENGTIHIHGQYKNDEAFGNWKWYDEKGNLLKTVEYGKTKN